jgi:ribosomal protein S18 acetylase RimI-like enzyme
MVSTYFKRYRMEADLTGREFPQIAPPPGYRLLAWEAGLLEAHAQAKYLSFRGEIDSHVFPCLGELAGCLRLMQEIAAKPGFVPEATWLAVHDDPLAEGRFAYVGTIQGLDTEQGWGSIQNLGVVPEHRGRGLGKCLLRSALAGFEEVGLHRVSLEVTAENRSAIHLYRDHGFRTIKTVFKSVDVAHPY